MRCLLSQRKREPVHRMEAANCVAWNVPYVKPPLLEEIQIVEYAVALE